MSNSIFEEETHTPTPPSSPASGASGKAEIEKKARQLAYDSKYRVKQTMNKGTRLDPASVKRAYLQQLAKSTSAPAIKLRAKQILLGDEYKNEIEELVEKNVIDALTKVFVEGVDEKKEWIVVTDKKTGNTYRRQATRAKISELRANPNISRVEITSYHPDKDDDKQGQKTAKVKAGKGLNNDGNLANNYPPYDKVTRGDVIAGATGNDQMGGKKKEKVREEVIFEKEDSSRPKKITGKGVNNKSLIKVFPNSVTEQQIQDKPQDKPQDQVSQNQKTTANPNDRKQISILQQFQRKEDQLNRQKLAAQKQGKLPVGSVQMNSYEPDGEEVTEKMNLATADVGDVVNDFYGSDAPQFKGKTKEKRREMAIAAALTAKRGGRKLGEEKCGNCNSESGCNCDKNSKEKESNEDSVDSREIPTKVNLVKNKLRAMGLKMSYEPKGNVVSEEETDRERDTDREERYGASRSRGSGGATRDSRGRVIMRNPKYRPSQDPRMGSMSDSEWARSPQNPSNQRSKRRY